MTLKEFTKDYNIFQNIRTRHPTNLTWLPDATLLNKYMGVRYAHRNIDDNIVETPNPDIDFISDCILLSYENKWDRFYELTIKEYDAIANVDANETTTETRNLQKTQSDTETRNLQKTNSFSDTRTTDSTVSTDTTNTQSNTNTSTQTGSTDNKVNAYNNATAKPTNKSETSLSDTTTLTGRDTVDTDTTTDLDETLSHNQTDTDTGTVTHSNTDTDTGTVTTTVRRIGNIGVTMTQQLIQADLDLWDKNKLIDTILFDVADFLTTRVW